MHVWVSYLIDHLKAYSPTCHFDVTEKSSPKVSDVCPYHNGLKTLRPGTLYLCLEEHDIDGLSAPPDTYFILPPGVPLPKNGIRLSAPPEQDALYDLLAGCMERYRNWYDRMTQLVLSRADPRQIIDAGSEMLENPVLVLNSAFSLIVVSSDARPEDFPFFDFENTMRPMPEFLFSMGNRISVTRDYHMQGSDRYSVTTHTDGALELHYNICDEDRNPEVNIISTIRTPAVTQGYLDVFLDLCTFLKRTLQASQQTPLPSTLSAFALDHLLIHGNPSAMLHLLKAQPAHRFLFGMYDENPYPRRYRLNALLQVQDVMPHSIAFVHEERICFVACVSDKASDADYLSNQYRRIDAFAAAAGGTVGLSNPLATLDFAKDGLRQAEQALRCPPLRFPGPAPSQYAHLRFYADVSVSDMLAFFLNDKQADCYIPPEISALYHADRQSGEDNCAMLLYYLLAGKSLAATGEAFHLHRNTIAYRIKRMKDLYGVNVDKPIKNVAYLLACILCMTAPSDADDDGTEKEV